MSVHLNRFDSTHRKRLAAEVELLTHSGVRRHE